MAFGGGACQVCISLSTLPVILEIVSLDSEAR
jgi:hypothetical protein